MSECNLNKAIRGKDIVKLRQLLEKEKYSLNEIPDKTFPPVIGCIVLGTSQGFRSDEKGDNVRDENDTKRCQMLNLLIQCGAGVNIRAGPDKSMEGFDKEEDLEEYTDGWTAAMFAAREGYLKCLRFLVASDADLNTKSYKTKQTALHIAVDEDCMQTECVKFLTEHMTSSALNYRIGTVDGKQDGRTALMMAASNGWSPYGEDHLHCMKYLLAAGADVNFRTKYGCTALYYAVPHSLAAVKILLENGAQVNTVDDEGKTPLTVALGFVYEDQNSDYGALAEWSGSNFLQERSTQRPQVDGSW